LDTGLLDVPNNAAATIRLLKTRVQSLEQQLQALLQQSQGMLSQIGPSVHQQRHAYLLTRWLRLIAIVQRKQPAYAWYARLAALRCIIIMYHLPANGQMDLSPWNAQAHMPFR
jgi:hypothetical protein